MLMIKNVANTLLADVKVSVVFCKITDIISGGSHERFIIFAVL